MSKFSGDYKQMFFSSISKWKGNLHTNTCAAYCCFPVLTYARKYCNLSPVTSTEDVVLRFTPATIRKMQPVTQKRSKEDARYDRCKTGISAIDSRLKHEERYPSDASHRKT